MSTDLPVDFITQAPLIPTTKALELVRENYGIRSATITQLSGYDDLNFLLEDIVFDDNEDSKKYSQRLICKFTNPIEARLPGLLGKYQV
jgi:ATP-dependent exoDNAse (exonuclease V) alpha subunit